MIEIRKLFVFNLWIVVINLWLELKGIFVIWGLAVIFLVMLNVWFKLNCIKVVFVGLLINELFWVIFVLFVKFMIFKVILLVGIFVEVDKIWLFVYNVLMVIWFKVNVFVLFE